VPNACSEKTRGVRRSGSPCEGGLTLCGQKKYRWIVASLQFRLKISARSAIVDTNLRPKAISGAGLYSGREEADLSPQMKARSRVNVKLSGLG
jgi:hypothetical protein